MAISWFNIRLLFLSRSAGRWIIILIAAAALALLYSHSYGASVCLGPTYYAGECHALLAQGVVVILLTAAALIYNQQRKISQ